MTEHVSIIFGVVMVLQAAGDRLAIYYVHLSWHPIDTENIEDRQWIDCTNRSDGRSAAVLVQGTNGLPEVPANVGVH